MDIDSFVARQNGRCVRYSVLALFCFEKAGDYRGNVYVIATPITDIVVPKNASTLHVDANVFRLEKGADGRSWFPVSIDDKEYGAISADANKALFPLSNT
ncbi:MAG: hypothetical protein PHI19_00195 [Clostridia bacterium]|jgi:hypothetical protein|nr:hypothetical protein [Clostridia bacterium]